jgi:polysaccharide biosynthesis/export protein
MGAWIERRVIRALCLIAGVLLPLAGCTAYSQPATPVSTAPHTYVLRPNDQIRVQVYNEPNISGDYKIDGGGTVSIPLAGRLRAAGLTTAQLERSIVLHVDGSLLKDPHVNVQVSTFSPFFVRGEVKQPGQFQYMPGLTVGDAVAMAGGYTYRADESAAFVRRSGGAQEEVRTLSFDTPISPGDNIRIPERYF